MLHPIPQNSLQRPGAAVTKKQDSPEQPQHETTFAFPFALALVPGAAGVVRGVLKALGLRVVSLKESRGQSCTRLVGTICPSSHGWDVVLIGTKASKP